MKGRIDRPKIFISYSWSNTLHEEWVIDLAERLMSDGIHVILDKWDLKEGQDKYHFIEQMVNEEQIKRVLLICDKEYKEKADLRKKGVGEEALVISKEIYNSVNQNKFIPIIKERNKLGEAYIPAFISTRIYIDLSDSDKFEKEYEKLIRNIYEKPLYVRPSLGTPPIYIEEDTPLFLPTTNITRNIKNQLEKGNTHIQGFINKYFEIFIDHLEEYRIEPTTSKEIDDNVVESIDKLILLRDDFIEFNKAVFSFNVEVKVEDYKDFFESLIKFHFRKEEEASRTDLIFDNYKFFITEIILYFITILLSLKKYEQVSYFIYSTYFYRYDNRNNLKAHNISIFNRYIASLDETRNQRLNLRRISITADKLKEHANRSDYPFSKIQETDFLLYALTLLCNPSDRYSIWLPRTSVYRNYRNNGIFERLISKSFFERTKSLFNVKTIDDLKQKLTQVADNPNTIILSSFNYDIPTIDELFEIDKIGSLN
jgi:hypothetical protein